MLDPGGPRSCGWGAEAPHNLPLPTLEATAPWPAAYRPLTGRALDAPTSSQSVSPQVLCTCRLWPRKPLRDS